MSDEAPPPQVRRRGIFSGRPWSYAGVASLGEVWRLPAMRDGPHSMHDPKDTTYFFLTPFSLDIGFCDLEVP